MNHILSGFVNIFAPPLCPICNKNINIGGGVCKLCSGDFVKLKALCRVCGISMDKTFGGRKPDRGGQTCGDCLVEKKFFKMSRSAVEYTGPVRVAVSSFKYENGFHNEKLLTELIVGRAIDFEEEVRKKFDIIVPVPLHSVRLKKRGYNQSLLLSNSIGRELSLRVEGHGLLRIKDTAPQVGLKPRQRISNVKGAFGLGRGENTRNIKGKIVLLVDDVYTTGATINECSKILSKVAKEVYALTVARTVPE